MFGVSFWACNLNWGLEVGSDPNLTGGRKNGIVSESGAARKQQMKVSLSSERASRHWRCIWCRGLQKAKEQSSTTPALQRNLEWEALGAIPTNQPSPTPCWGCEPIPKLKRCLGQCHAEWPQMPPLHHLWEAISLQQKPLLAASLYCRSAGQGGMQGWGNAHSEKDRKMHPLIPGWFCIPRVSHEVLNHHTMLWKNFSKHCRRREKREKETPLIYCKYSCSTGQALVWSVDRIKES